MNRRAVPGDHRGFFSHERGEIETDGVKAITYRFRTYAESSGWKFWWEMSTLAPSRSSTSTSGAAASALTLTAYRGPAWRPATDMFGRDAGGADEAPDRGARGASAIRPCTTASQAWPQRASTACGPFGSAEPFGARQRSPGLS
jgi:hypothetical protein